MSGYLELIVPMPSVITFYQTLKQEIAGPHQKCASKRHQVRKYFKSIESFKAFLQKAF